MSTSLLLVIFLCISTTIMSTSLTVISDSLLSKLKHGGKSTAIINMVRQAQEALDSVEGMTFSSRDERATVVTRALNNLANESQKEHKALLDVEGASYESLWISNSIVVRDASLELLHKLEKLGGIQEIREEHTVHIMGEM